MEIVISNCNFNIQPGMVNSIMGFNLNIQEILNIKKCNDYRLQIGVVVEPPIEQMFYYNVKRHLSFIACGDKNFNESQSKKIIDSLKMVGLTPDFLNRKIKTLSQSELYKVALASSLINNPKIIVFDNPFVNLDDNNKKKFIQLIRTIKNRYKKTIIIISNQSDDLHEISDYLFLVDNNKVILEGNKYVFYDQDDILKKQYISLPKIMKFEKMVYNKKGKKIGYRDNINDLIKDIYFHK